MMLEELKYEILGRFELCAFEADPIRSDVHEITHRGVDAVRRTFEGKLWSDVNMHSEIANIGDSIVFLTFDAYCYFFPAFLMQLTDASLIASNLCESFIDHVNPRNVDEKLVTFYLELGERKQTIVAQFLAYEWAHFQDTSALDALEDFWDAFLTTDQRKAVYESPEAIHIQASRLQITAANKRR